MTGPVPSAAAYGAAMTTVEPGMTRSQVKRLFGNPAQSITDRDYMSLYTSASGRGFGLWRRTGGV